MSFLRQLFGPSREEVWRQLSAEIGANYVDGGFWKGDKVQARHGEWTITLDTFTRSTQAENVHTSQRYTRMRAPFVNNDGFQFAIYRSSFLTGLGKLFGMQDVEIGDPEFDQEFVIKGNDEAKLRALFADHGLRRLIQAQPSIRLEIKDDEGWFSTTFPEGVDELHFCIAGVITDVERLKALYELFAETLEQLCRIGSAYEQDPRVEL